MQATVWEGPLDAGHCIYAAAMRVGDLAAAEAIQARLRRDLGLDALDYGAENARTSLALACQPVLYGYLGLEHACLSGVETLARSSGISRGGTGIPLHRRDCTRSPLFVEFQHAAADHLASENAIDGSG